MAQTQAAKEAIWLTRLLSELDIGFSLLKRRLIACAYCWFPAISWQGGGLQPNLYDK